MPHFETFTKRMVPLKRDPLVTIQKRGTISLNKSAHVALGEPAAVELLFDRDSRIIGLRAVDGEVDHAYPLRASAGKDAGPYIISAMAFTHFYEIDMSVSRRWVAFMDDDVLCVDLTGQSTVVTGSRAAAEDA